MDAQGQHAFAGENISTGTLPRTEAVQAWVNEAHARYRNCHDGRNSDVYPPLEQIPGDLFGVCLVGVGGDVFAAGDVSCEFPIMSVAKPFVFALVCQALGPAAAREAVGVNATGLPFNSLAAVECDPEGRTNPMVNAGAIAATSLVPGTTPAAKWSAILEGLSLFAGRALEVDNEIYRFATATNHRNRSIAHLLESRGRIYCDTATALDLYTRQSSLSVTAKDLAVMGATLADGGVNPATGLRVIDESVCGYTLAVMTTAGLYETSGDWIYDVGVPGKSGIGGGIVAVTPGKGGLGTFAPRLDEAGNSVQGQLAARFLSHRLGLHLFLSRPYAA